MTSAKIRVLCLDNGTCDPVYVTKTRRFTDINQFLRACLCPPHSSPYEIRIYILNQDEVDGTEENAFRNLWLESYPQALEAAEQEVRSKNFDLLWSLAEGI